MSIINVKGVIVNEDCKIKYDSNNKKRVGSKSWERYEDYKDSKSIGEFLSSGGKKEDLRWDLEKGFLELLESYDYKMKKVIKL